MKIKKILLFLVCLVSFKIQANNQEQKNWIAIKESVSLVTSAIVTSYGSYILFHLLTPIVNLYQTSNITK